MHVANEEKNSMELYRIRSVENFWLQGMNDKISSPIIGLRHTLSMTCCFVLLSFIFFFCENSFILFLASLVLEFCDLAYVQRQP
jgi:hypothetical protein